jgi:RPA family protein
MKELRKIYDPKTNQSYLVSIRTKIVRQLDGEYPDDLTVERILKLVLSRIKTQKRQSERDATLRSLGLVKVRGPISGDIYWE